MYCQHVLFVYPPWQTYPDGKEKIPDALPEPVSIYFCSMRIFTAKLVTCSVDVTDSLGELAISVTTPLNLRPLYASISTRAVSLW